MTSGRSEPERVRRSRDANVEIVHEYLHHRSGYRFGNNCCRLCIYGAEAGDAPIVIASEPDRIGDSSLAEMSEYLAAEVVQHHFAGYLTDLPRPLLWIEHRPDHRKRGPGRYFLLDFPGYRPTPARAGFVRPVTLGSPRREELTPAEVAALIG